VSDPIRLARADDARAVAHVHVTTWQDAYRGLLPDEYLDSLDVTERANAYRRAGLLTDPERPVFVYEKEGRIDGFGWVGPSADEPGSGELYAIYVTASNWGTGVGRDLMDAAERWLAERFTAATLWVLVENVRARRFYEKRGWALDGATKDDDREAFVMHEVRYRRDFRSA
jgi:GNAT superfamily N-acetyltransferase